jgi:hypothetical protein
LTEKQWVPRKLSGHGASRAIYSATTGTNIYHFIPESFRGSASGELQVTGGSLSSDSTTVTYIASGGQTATLNQSGWLERHRRFFAVRHGGTGQHFVFVCRALAD